MAEDAEIKDAEERAREKLIAELEQVLIDCWGGNKLLLAEDWRKLRRIDVERNGQRATKGRE